MKKLVWVMGVCVLMASAVGCSRVTAERVQDRVLVNASVPGTAQTLNEVHNMTWEAAAFMCNVPKASNSNSVQRLIGGDTDKWTKVASEFLDMLKKGYKVFSWHIYDVDTTCPN